MIRGLLGLDLGALKRVCCDFLRKTESTNHMLKYRFGMYICTGMHILWTHPIYIFNSSFHNHPNMHVLDQLIACCPVSFTNPRKKRKKREMPVVENVRQFPPAVVNHLPRRRKTMLASTRINNKPVLRVVLLLPQQVGRALIMVKVFFLA